MVKEDMLPSRMYTFMQNLDDVGYESALLVFNSDRPDKFIKAANSIDSSSKIKFMIAIRPYAISSRYLTMQCAGFNQIKKDSLILNIIAGTFDHDAAKFDVYNSVDDRKIESAEFVVSLRQHMSELNDKTPIYFSGSSDITLQNANAHGDGIINLLSSLREDAEVNVIARCWILIRDTDSEAKKAYDYLDERTKMNCIYGTENTVFNKLKNIPADEFMISSASTPDQRVHNFIKSVLTNQQ
jgi:alkanesulfonate monooxygenase SsuD/methylene tetrahydromethanopterin reductase-like flavin-dependent oxidoreductase (luciferase family)